MFAFQSMKRARDDDSGSEDERYLKKSCSWSITARENGSTDYSSRPTLPLRLSLTPSPPQALPELEDMTPAHSDPSEANSPASVPDDPIQFSSPRNADFDGEGDMDMDMDMDEDEISMISSPPLSPPIAPTFQTPLRPAKLDASLFSRHSPANNTGRIPTPMYPNFHVPRDPMSMSMSMSSMGGLAYPSSGSAGAALSNNYLSPSTNSAHLAAPPLPSKQPQTDQDRTRRMPSPISEDEDIPRTPTALTQSQLSRLRVTPIAEEQMELGEASMEDGDADCEGASVALAPPPGVCTTPTRGRKRSGALSGRGRFSMGYRDDCEKCSQRVPGHYSHFLP